MMCTGKQFCKIYRDKSYCSKVQDRIKENDECECRHARRKCEIARCAFEDICPEREKVNE